MIQGLVRPPAVAGFFYESDKDLLLKRIEWSFLHEVGPGSLPPKNRGSRRESLGYIVPHAGYIYSGPVAAHAYYSLSIEKSPETIILIGPNHTGLGSPVSIAPWREWKTPLGRIPIDREMFEWFVRNSSLVMPDYDAHIQEHSIEVQLPYLQYIYNSGIKILPIVAYDQTPEVARGLAEEIRRAIEELGRDVVILASSDLNHYDPHEVTLEKDRKAIDAIMSLDPERFFQTIVRENITVCGPIGIMVLMYLARTITHVKPVVLKHATSGDTSGDKSSVVGYLAAQFRLDSA